MLASSDETHLIGQRMDTDNIWVQLERLALDLLWWGAPVFGDERTHHIQPSPFSLTVL